MADEGGEVQIRLSQEGGDEILSKLSEIIGRLGELSETSGKTSAATSELGASMKRVSESGAETSFATTASAVMQFATQVYDAGEKLLHYTERLIDARSEHEQFIIKLAALDEGMLGWSGAMTAAASNLDALQRMSANASMGSLVTVFQRLTLLVGGTDQQLQDLTQRMELFAQKSGVTAEQLLRVIQMAERTGQLPMRGQMAVASLALKNAGISGQDIREAALEGGDALQTLLEKVKVSAEAADAMNNSWANLLAGLKRTVDEGIVDEVAAGLDGLKGTVKELNAALQSEETKAGIESVTQQLTGLSEQVKNLLAPSGMQESINYYAGLLEKVLQMTRSFVLAWTTLFQLAAEGLATAWDVMSSIIKNPFDIDEHTKRLKDGLASDIAIIRNAANEAVEIWKGARKEMDEDPDLAAGANYISHHDLATGHDPLTDFEKQIKAATDALDEVYKKGDEKHSLAGLDGLDKQLADIKAQAAAADEALTKAYNKAIEAGWKPTAADSKKFDAQQVRIYSDAQAEADKAVADNGAKLQKQYTDAVEKEAKQREQIEAEETKLIDGWRRKGTTDAIALIDQQATAEINSAQERVQKIERSYDDLFRKQTDGYQADLNDYLDMLEKKKALEAEFAAYVERVLAEAERKKKEIRDLGAGDWDAYYADLMQRAKDSGQNLFVAAQENSRHVADEMVKAAQTAGDGWNAGLAKIRTSVTSFGQDVAGLMTSVWGQLTSSFETGFYDILSGKFDDLKNVLRSLWDDILKDFSKLLVQMLERWILTGDAMGNGQQGGGGFGGIFGKLLGGTEGGPPVTTPQGLGPSTWQPGGGYGTSGTYYGSGEAIDAGMGSGGGLGTLGTIGAYGAYAYGLYSGVSSLFKPHETSTPTYNGQSLGQTADFGGPGGGAALSAAMTVIGVAATATAAAAAAGMTIAAAAASVVPVVGWIAAAVLLVVAAIMSIFSGPQEGHVYVAIKDAFDKTDARSAVGGIVNQIIESTANYVGELALKAAGPEGVAGYMAKYRDAFKAMFGTATFDIAAGSSEDLQKDVNNFFNNVLPKFSMQAAFGQWGYGMAPGDRDWAGGLAGVDWNANNASRMDAQGNFIHQQLFDPNAPIPQLLAGIGFSADAIGAIAQKLAGSSDMKAFKQYLLDLVSAVVDLGELSKAFARTTQEWFDFIHTAEKQQGTVAQFQPQIANLQAQAVLMEAMTGDDRVAAAKQLVTDSQTLLQNMAGALQAIVDMMDTIKKQTRDTVASYEEKLLTPAEREKAARGRYESDLYAITSAANPKEVQDAWNAMLKDLTTVLDAIVARINAIKALQQSYADFRQTMDTNAGPQFATDPFGWLQKNQEKINAVTTTLATATGDDAVAAAQQLLTLTQDRYNNELAMLQRVNQTIQSINDSYNSSIDNLALQGMGSVVNGKWTPDTKAQGQYLIGKINELMPQFASAQTPEEVNRLWSQIQGFVSQLAAQPQDPAHYAESRTFLAGLLTSAKEAALARLHDIGGTLEGDLKDIGKQLEAGEKALKTALDAAQKDFTTELGKMTAASTAATQALTKFADGLTDAMNELTKTIKHEIWVLTHKDTEPDPNWDYEHNMPKGEWKGGVGGEIPPQGPGMIVGPGDVWIPDPKDPQHYEICVHGPSTGQRRPRGGASPGGGTSGPGGGDHTPSAASATAGGSKTPLTVTVNVNSGAPEDVAAAAADAVYPTVFAALKQNNAELVRTIRNNPNLIDR